MSETGYLVYEIVNLDRREVVVGIAGAPVEAVRFSDPELEPENWQPGHRILRRVIESKRTLDEAAAFALAHSESAALRAKTVYLAGVPRHA